MKYLKNGSIEVPFMKHMITTVALLCVGVLGYAQSSQKKECDKESFNTEITQNKVTGEYSIEVVSSKKAYFIFFDEAKDVLNFNVEINKVEGLEKGIYYCRMMMVDGCKKTLTFDLKATDK